MTLEPQHTTPEKFYIEAGDDGANEVLSIDRVSTEMTLIGRKDVPPSAVTRQICGVMGTMRLVAGMYLLVITKKRKVGDLLGHAVWKAVEFDLISYKKTVLHLTDNQMQDNKAFLAMINNVLNTDGFYFATDYDLTHTLQRLANTSPEFQEMSLLERDPHRTTTEQADQRFVWNGHLLRDFSAQPELHRFACPVIHGYIAMRSCCINGKVFDWNLISRRSCFRAGVRYYVRGIDSEGHAANFVETEQIVQYSGSKASFVQAAGRFPEAFRLSDHNLRQTSHLKPGMGSLHSDHGKRGMVFPSPGPGGTLPSKPPTPPVNGLGCGGSTINQKGSEKPLELAFAKMVENLGNGMIKYVAFDFHKECSRMRWHRLQILVDSVAELQDEFGYDRHRTCISGRCVSTVVRLMIRSEPSCNPSVSVSSYFLVDADGTVQVHQEGTFRSNCMDCLDRTNVVQSLLARRSLQSQLQRMGVLHSGQRIEDQNDFEKIYKNGEYSSCPAVPALPCHPCSALPSLPCPAVPALPCHPCPAPSSLPCPAVPALPCHPCPAPSSLPCSVVPALPCRPCPAPSSLPCSVVPALLRRPCPAPSSLLCSVVPALLCRPCSAPSSLPCSVVPALLRRPCPAPSSLPCSVVPALLRRPCPAPSSLPCSVVPALLRRPCSALSSLLCSVVPALLRRPCSVVPALLCRPCPALSSLPCSVVPALLRRPCSALSSLLCSVVPALLRRPCSAPSSLLCSVVPALLCRPCPALSSLLRRPCSALSSLPCSVVPALLCRPCPAPSSLLRSVVPALLCRPCPALSSLLRRPCSVVPALLCRPCSVVPALLRRPCSVVPAPSPLLPWADNANACAKQYAGTGALKTDFTRTGKRTQWGLLMDGWNSMIRYYKNNFSDGFRQDSIDLFLGNYAVDEADMSTPLHEPKDWKFLTLPIIMVVAFSMCIICLLMADTPTLLVHLVDGQSETIGISPTGHRWLDSSGETWTETLAYVLFWGVASAVTFGVILFNGRDFVDAPKLVQKEKMD
ncbi:hypothetical protein NFI96_021902 [Prochilodus magdalenae]|nr:hypothetical protein NFI96_021902 [Prochilodus magdalenae]